MRALRAVLALAVVALVAGPSAGAHSNLLATDICGPQGCRSLGDGLFIFREHGEFEDHGFTVAPVPLPRSFYELKVRDFSERAYFVPGPDVVYAMELDGSWLWIALKPEDAEHALAAAEGMDPYPLALDRVLVDGRPVDDPDPYIKLFEPMAQASAPPLSAPRFEIVLIAGERNPWKETFSRFVFVPSAGTIQRAETWVEPSTDVSDQIRRDAGLLQEGRPGSRVLLIALMSGLAGAVALLAFTTWRRKRWFSASPRRASQPRPR